MGWQPIETAPKDGRKIDVWCASPRSSLRGVRFTDVSWRRHDETWGWIMDRPDRLNSGRVGVEWVILEIGNDVYPPWTPTHWMPLPASPDEAALPTPAAAEARATKATDYAKKVLEDMRARLVWSTDLAFRDRIDNAIRGLSLPPPEAKDGAAPSPERSGDAGEAQLQIPLRPEQQPGIATEISGLTKPRSGTAAPSPETPMQRIHREQLARPRLTPDPGMVWRNPAPDASPPGAPTEGYRRISTADFAPAAPSPDLAALEELAGRMEHCERLGIEFAVGDPRCRDFATAIRTAILHLPAQPNLHGFLCAGHYQGTGDVMAAARKLAWLVLLVANAVLVAAVHETHDPLQTLIWALAIVTVAAGCVLAIPLTDKDDGHGRG